VDNLASDEMSFYELHLFLPIASTNPVKIYSVGQDVSICIRAVPMGLVITHVAGLPVPIVVVPPVPGE
jgi:hypothetical protein